MRFLLKQIINKNVYKTTHSPIKNAFKTLDVNQNP